MPDGRSPVVLGLALLVLEPGWLAERTVHGPRGEAIGDGARNITDAHVAPTGRRTAVLKDSSVPILEDLIDQVNERGAHATLFGDNIDNQGEDGRGELEAFVRLAEKTGRFMCTVGNHEAVNVQRGGGRISKEDFAERLAGHGIVSRDQLNFSEIVGNVRVIGIDTTLTGTHGGYVAPRTMTFLARELRDAEEVSTLSSSAITSWPRRGRPIGSTPGIRSTWSPTVTPSPACSPAAPRSAPICAATTTPLGFSGSQAGVILKASITCSRPLRPPIPTARASSPSKRTR